MIIEPEKEDNRIFLILAIAFVLSLFVGWIMNQNHFLEGATCREKGGIYVVTRYENLCLKKNVVIQ